MIMIKKIDIYIFKYYIHINININIMITHLMDNGYITIKFNENEYNTLCVNINYVLNNGDIYIGRYDNNTSIVDPFKIKPTIVFNDKYDIHVNFDKNINVKLHNTQYIKDISIDEDEDEDENDDLCKCFDDCKCYNKCDCDDYECDCECFCECSCTGYFSFIDKFNNNCEGNYIDGCMNGYGKIIFFEGGIYEGNFIDDLFDGQGTYYYKNNDVYIGQFKNGLKNGYGEYIYNDQKQHKYIGQFKDDKKNGIGKIIYTNYDVQNVIYKDDEIIETLDESSLQVDNDNYNVCSVI